MVVRSYKKEIVSPRTPILRKSHGEYCDFAGCMAYLAECLGFDSNTYDYDYFATAIEKNNKEEQTSRSFDVDLVERAFQALEYRYEYVRGEMVRENRDLLIRKVKKNIDSHTPVIIDGLDEENHEICGIICGYTHDNQFGMLYGENEKSIWREKLLKNIRALVFTTEWSGEFDLD